MGRIITPGTFSSVTLLLLQPGALTHLMHLLLLAWDSIWSSHASVEGLKPWLWPWGWTMDQNMKKKQMHQLSMKPSRRALFAFIVSNTRRFCVTVWFCSSWLWCCASQAAGWPFHSCPCPFLLSCFSWGRHFTACTSSYSDQCYQHSRQTFKQDIQAGAWFSKLLAKNTC